MSDMKLALILSLDDRLVQPLRQALGQVKNELKDTQQALGNIVRPADRATEGLEKLGRKGGEAVRRTTGELRDMGRAADQAEARVGKLGESLGRMGNLVGKAGSLFAGFKAGQAVLADPRERAQTYELSLAKLSNVLFNDRRTVAGRQAGQTELDAAVRKASREGVTREDALAGLQVVGAAGGIDRKDAMGMLPTLAKFSVAGDASMEDVAALAVKSMKTSDISAENMPRALEMALIQGQLGNFDFKDMAKWLPQQMAVAKSMLGMSGLNDLNQLLAVNQLAANTAGNNAEAGNNVVNFLSKINAHETQAAFAKSGIDLSGSLARAREKGTSPIDAFLNLMQQEFGKDKGYAALQTKLQAARASGDKPGETKTLEAMSGIMSGSVLGKFMPDRQALAGMAGVMNNRQGLADLQREAAGRVGEADLSQQTLLATSAMKNRIADSSEQARQFDALKGLNDTLADSRMKLADLSVKYPEAAKWLEGMTLAVKAASAALMTFALGNVVNGALTGGAAGGLLTAARGGIAAIGTAGAVSAAAGGVGAAALWGGGLLAAGGVGYGVGTLTNMGINSVDKNLGTSVGDTIGFITSLVAAGFGSQDAQDALDQRALAEGQAQAAQALQKAAEALATRPPIKVVIDGREIASAVDDAVGRDARRW